MPSKGNDDAEAAVIGRTTILLAAIVLDVIAVLYRGWAAAILWRWFAMPMGAPALPAAYSAGFCVIVSLVFSRTRTYKDHNTDWTASIIGLAIGPLVALLTGWLLLQVAF